MSHFFGVRIVCLSNMSRWWFQIIFFHEDSHLDNYFFQTGWFNHQLDVTSNPPTGPLFLQPSSHLSCGNISPWNFQDFSCTLRSPRWSNREVEFSVRFVRGFSIKPGAVWEVRRGLIWYWDRCFWENLWKQIDWRSFHIYIYMYIYTHYIILYFILFYYILLFCIIL